MRIFLTALVLFLVGACATRRVERLLDTAHFPHAERPEIVFPAIEELLQ